MQRFLLFLFLLGLLAPVVGQQSHRIEVEISGYDQEILTLANNILESQYIVDTAYQNDAGKYVFASDTSALPAGIYIVVTAPDNNYFQILVGEGDQEFSVSTSVAALASVAVTGDEENELFHRYLAFLDAQQEKVAPLREVMNDSLTAPVEKTALAEDIAAVTAQVNAFQAELVRQSPGSFTAAIINANRPLPPPEFEELTDPETRRQAQWNWLQQHYFDNIDLRDERLLRTPFLFQRIEYYVDRLSVQHPDSISMAIDRVLSGMNPTGEMFKYYVVHFTNKAAQSKIVGMDGVYVHMVDNYYRAGRAYWSNEEQLLTMSENVEEIRPLLIGKQAPDIEMKTRAGEDVTLYGVDAKYTVLYFWSFDCGHCKKSTPYMKEFYAKWKNKGAEIFSICTKQNTLDQCWEYVDDQEIGDWMHVTDRYMRFYKDYAIRSTPTIFVLDENKKIVSKRIGAEQLDDVLTGLEAAAARPEKTGK
ncbi:redoxin domain-containing protein [Neolewinella antarctica]|uniref:Thiol-disulfide isomerase/thioredoxin n=1 Tax=Neolewinella antarctica TaxID=442734 RepID=A0ABX0X7Q4_9BACT|nr:redoxin domain-containing protein [Neolewinella antarctica]NJC25260.1 thiol-disulfide isomerase/thioredoxin [Neolewinella antarctica]